MTRPAPSRPVFYKYMKATVAKTVIATRRLRWSSPLLFNDPFDVTQELRLNFDEHGLNSAMTERVAWLIEYAEPATFNVKHPFFGPLIRGAMGQAPDARRNMASDLREGIGGPTPGQAAALQLLKDTWSAMVPTCRILCLSKVNDVAPMWHHYADKYQGVVLEFLAVEEVAPAWARRRLRNSLVRQGRRRIQAPMTSMDTRCTVSPPCKAPRGPIDRRPEGDVPPRVFV